MRHTGKILVLAYPDTFVTMSTEFICKLLPLVGLGTREYIKAGHAALILINNTSGKASYFDFGRYVTPKGYGRVRGANTDAELMIPLNAEIDSEGNLKNLEKLLLWLEAHPEKTHGEGRLLASICNEIDYDAAKKYIDQLQNKGSIPYGAFEKKGSNCSRFVTDTILASTSNETIKKRLNFNKKFTPSTVGNVEKAAFNREVYEVFNGEIKPFKGSALKENLTNYFDKKRRETSEPISIKQIPEDAQLLKGTGSNAWFLLIDDEDLPLHHYRIKRYNDSCEKDFDGVYFCKGFNAKRLFQFTYDSHCKYCTIIQNNSTYVLKCVGVFSEFNLAQKEHSA